MSEILRSFTPDKENFDSNKNLKDFFRSSFDIFRSLNKNDPIERGGLDSKGLFASLEKNIVNSNRLDIFDQFLAPQTINLPGLSHAPTHLTHQAVVDDFGYSFLRDANDRAELLVRMVEITMDIERDGVNTVVFCDRGARPLAVLVAQLWGAVSERPLPPFFFINTDPKWEYNFDAGEIPSHVLAQMKEWLSDEYPDGDNPLRDGQAKIRVIDETKATGRSARFVADIIRRAFPDEVDGIDCVWAEARGMPWRDCPAVIGADTDPGKFKSRQLETAQAKLLTEDLMRLAQEHGLVSV